MSFIHFFFFFFYLHCNKVEGDYCNMIFFGLIEKKGKENEGTFIFSKIIEQKKIIKKFEPN